MLPNRFFAYWALYVSQNEGLDKYKKYHAGDAEYSGNECAYPANGDIKPDEASEEVYDEKYHKADKCVDKKLHCPFYRLCEYGQKQCQKQKQTDGNNDRRCR